MGADYHAEVFYGFLIDVETWEKENPQLSEEVPISELTYDWISKNKVEFKDMPVDITTVGDLMSSRGTSFLYITESIIGGNLEYDFGELAGAQEIDMDPEKLDQWRWILSEFAEKLGLVFSEPKWYLGVSVS